MGQTLSDDGIPATNFTTLADHNRPLPNTPLKRLFDIVAASGLLILSAPLLLVVALMIRLHDGQPARFSQERLGFGGRTFRCHKIRSMVPDAASRLQAILATDPAARDEWDRTQKLTHDPRITPLGQFIRKTSIDELPQLWNVLKGEMSLVGPRPINESERVRYGADFGHYASVRPGLTGLWQISGRSDVSYEQRVALDKAYVEDRTFWGDIRIMLLTVPAVLKSRGAR